MSGVCYIVGAGTVFGTLCPTEHDLVIAADGGYDALCRMGVRCDLIIGDMDSVKCAPNDIPTVRVPVEKDETDTYLCYLEGVHRGYDDFAILGGVGGRDDHTFANFSLLLGAICEKKRIRIIGEQFDIFAIKDEKIEIPNRVGHALSVFAFGSDCEGVRITGCKYTADRITLTQAFPLGVSNEITASPAAVEVSSGTLLVMLERTAIKHKASLV